MVSENHQKPGRSISGVGVGLRACHYDYILEHRPDLPWFEVLSDNYMVEGGPALQYLDSIRAHYPVSMHGVGLSIGSTDSLNQDYLRRLKKLMARVEPAFISDHLCWVSVDGQYLHDLFPLPYTELVVQHVAARIRQVQDFLGEQILIENVSSYLSYQESEMTEWEFLNAVANAADCYILLDINNIYVSAMNHHFDPKHYVSAVNAKRVKQYHLAGYEQREHYLFDSHSEAVHQTVWDLYRFALEKVGEIPTLIEWDSDIPSFPDLFEEAKKAQSFWRTK